MNTLKRIVIIGGGIAGFCVGIHAWRNGFGALIVEKHDIAGGLATAWTRHGYTFENCIHWFVGSKPGADLHDCGTKRLISMPCPFSMTSCI